MPHHTRNDTYSVLSIGLSGRTSSDFLAEELPGHRDSRHPDQSIFLDCETSHTSTFHALKGKIAIFLLFKMGKLNTYISPKSGSVQSSCPALLLLPENFSLSGTLILASLGPQVSHWELRMLGSGVPTKFSINPSHQER